MKRTAIPLLLLVCFLVSFCFSGVNAVSSIAAKDGTITTVETFVSHLSSVYSLSSTAVLLLPFVLVLSLLAFVSYIGKQKNVGFLFTAAAIVFYVVFLFAYCAETRNNSVYNVINELFKAEGLKPKKRDVFINMAPTWHCFLTIGLGLLTCAASFPNFKTKTTRYNLKLELEPYAYIAPHVLFFTLFSLVPIIYGLYTGFTKWDIYNEPVFAGLTNFETILFKEGNTYYNQLRNGLWNTIKFVIFCVPFCIIVPLSLALALNARPKGNKIFQALYYLPSLMSISTVTLTWRYVFNTQYGIVNKFFGFQGNFFVPPYTWIMLVIVTVWWCTGSTMVIYQSALASVPQDQYEAASVDGAGTIQKFFNVTLPNMTYPLMYTLVTAVVAQFNIYGQPDILVGFSNAEANSVLLQYIYENSVKKQVAGMSSAMAVILGLCIMVVSFIQMRMMVKNQQD